MTRNHNLTCRAGVWQCRRWENGREVSKSLKTRDVREARRLRDELLTGKVAPESADLKLSEALAAVEASLYRLTASKASHAALSVAFVRFCDWLPAGITLMREIAPGMAYEYAESMHADGLAAGTINQHLGHLGHLLDILRKDYRAKGMPEPCLNPFADIPRTKNVQSVGRKPFTPDQVRRLMMVAPSKEWRDLVLVMAHTGLRRGDAINLCGVNLDMERNIIDVLPAKTAGRGRRAIIGMSPDVRRVLAARNADGQVFPGIAQMYAEKRWTIGRIFAWMVERVGLESQVDAGTARARSVYGFHSLRHGFKTTLMSAGVRDSLIDVMMGHSHSGARQAYVHAENGLLDDALLQAVRSAFPPIQETSAGRSIPFRKAG